ncbi:MAG: IclR family transcriptional regulator [Actinomycetia bacterium]|nr:IclR family transcriptional regulator [Actinomycetes bacterium]
MTSREGRNRSRPASDREGVGARPPLAVGLETAKSPDRSRYLVPSLQSAVRILQYLSQARHRESNLTQIARDLGLNRSTAYRIVLTLQSAGMVEYDDTSRTYRLGPELAVLGARAITLNEFLRRAQEVVTQVMELTRATTLLVQRIAFDKMAYVLKATPEASLHITANVGQVFPITAGSHGKVFLAYMDPEERDTILAKTGYPAYTPYTIQGRENLLAELERVRQEGMAVSWQEHVLGVVGVAVPIFRTGTQRVAACLSVIALSAAVSPDQAREWGRAMQHIVRQELVVTPS